MQTLSLDIGLLFAEPLLAQGLRSQADMEQNRRDDMELVGRARRGDPRAMQELYQRHAKMVYLRLTHLVGADPEREDLLQEVFMALFRQLGSFRGEARLTTYLQRIATNKAYDHLRRRARAGNNEDHVVEGADKPSLEPSPERASLDSERAALLWRCLDQLKPNKRIAFVLRVVEGLSLKEISEQVDASVPTVAQRVRHARMELTEMVRQHEDTGGIPGFPQKEDGR